MAEARSSRHGKTKIPQSEQPWFIYALIDPREDKIRYVGATRQSVAYRVVQHLTEARNKRAKPRIYEPRTHKDSWLCELVAAGHRPIYALLQSGRGIGWEDAERWWIAFYRDLGWPLTNISHGGNGGHSETRIQVGWSEETTARVREKRNQNAYHVEAFGESKSINDWLKDSRCTVHNYRSMLYRIASGNWSAEDAISDPLHTSHLTAFGETKSVAAWAKDRRCIVPAMTLSSRISCGWSAKSAITTPSRARRDPAAVVCAKGHAMEGDNLIAKVRKIRSGKQYNSRKCRICEADTGRARVAARREARIVDNSSSEQHAA